MPRSALTDLLQVYPFWLMDVAPIDPLGLPIFSPLFGFSAITAPEIQLEIEDIPEANWYFTQKVIKRASISEMTLQRGVSWADSDFWKWTVASLTGNTEAFQPRTGVVSQAALFAAGVGAEAGGGTQTFGGAVGAGIGGAVGIGLGVAGALFGVPRIGGASPRRRLLLIHFFSRNPFGSLGAAGDLIAAGLTSAVGAAAGLSIVGAATTALGAFTPGPFQISPRLPAKAYLLHGCIPTRYKLTGDFDASSSDVSVQELGVAVEMVEEISLAT